MSDLIAIASELHARGIGFQVVTAATASDFKITCKTKLPAGLDSGMLSMYENTSLRNRVSFEDITTTKLVNMYKKWIQRTLVPEPHRSGIEAAQQPRLVTQLICAQYGDRFGAEPKQRLSFTVELVNEHGKPVYTADDVTPKLELKLTETAKAK